MAHLLDIVNKTTLMRIDFSQFNLGEDLNVKFHTKKDFLYYKIESEYNQIIYQQYKNFYVILYDNENLKFSYEDEREHLIGNKNLLTNMMRFIYTYDEETYVYDDYHSLIIDAVNITDLKQAPVNSKLKEFIEEPFKYLNKFY